MYLLIIICSDQALEDVWIGLHRSSAVCSCSQAMVVDCTACRASWSWTDGTAMSWWNWVPREPGTSQCGRLVADGWAEYACDSSYRFICERGTYIFLVHLQRHV